MSRLRNWYPLFHIALGLFLATGLLTLTPGISQAASRFTGDNDSYYSGYHVYLPKSDITAIYGTWKLPCENTPYWTSGGGHGSWIGIGGIGPSSPFSIKVGSSVDYNNGSYSYLWYEGADGILHQLGKSPHNLIYCGYTAYVVAAIFLNSSTGSFRYDIRVVSDITLQTPKVSSIYTGDLGFASTNSAEWEDSRPVCNGGPAKLNKFGTVYWHELSFTTSNGVKHPFLNQGISYEDSLYSQSQLIVGTTTLYQDSIGNAFYNSWRSTGSGTSCAKGSLRF